MNENKFKCMFTAPKIYLHTESKEEKVLGTILKHSNNQARTYINNTDFH